MDLLPPPPLPPPNPPRPIFKFYLVAAQTPDTPSLAAYQIPEGCKLIIDFSQAVQKIEVPNPQDGVVYGLATGMVWSSQESLQPYFVMPK